MMETSILEAMDDPVDITGDAHLVLSEKSLVDAGVRIARLMQAKYPDRRIEINVNEGEIRLWNDERRYYTVFFRAYGTLVRGLPKPVWFAV